MNLITRNDVGRKVMLRDGSVHLITGFDVVDERDGEQPVQLGTDVYSTNGQYFSDGHDMRDIHRFLDDDTPLLAENKRLVEASPTIKVGSVVQLNSGGPLMTVEEVIGDNTVTAAFFNNSGEAESVEFDKACLTLKSV